MAVQSRTVTVTTTASRIDQEDGGSQGFAVYNNGSATVYLGGSGVTTSNGYPLAAGEHMGADLDFREEAIYAVCASGTVEVRVLEVSV